MGVYNIYSQMTDNRLDYNLDAFTEFSNVVDDKIEELSSQKAKVKESLELLETTWETPAGEKFFAEQATDWLDQVDDYIKILGTLKEMVQYAHTTYSEVTEYGEKLKLK